MKECKCIPCEFCRGSGRLWKGLDGTLSSYRGDDLDELEDCDQCGGSGIDDECEYCQEINANIEYDN